MIIFLGLLLGCVSSFLGIGGGVFLVPLLPRIFQLTAHQAVILSLTFIFISVVINTLQYQLQNKIVWSLVLKMAPFIVLGGFLGSKTASMVPEIYLRLFLCLFLLVMSLSFLKVTSKKKGIKIHPYLLGGFSGILSGFAGVGSGVFLNWVVLNHPQVQNKKEAPTVNAMMIFVCLGVFFSSFFLDFNSGAEILKIVGVRSFLFMTLGILIGSYVGKYLNGLGLHRLRVGMLTGITFSLAILVFYEILSQ